jgi:hypothetical protein
MLLSQPISLSRPGVESCHTRLDPRRAAAACLGCTISPLDKVRHSLRASSADIVKIWDPSLSHSNPKIFTTRRDSTSFECDDDLVAEHSASTDRMNMFPRAKDDAEPPKPFGSQTCRWARGLDLRGGLRQPTGDLRAFDGGRRADESETRTPAKHPTSHSNCDCSVSDGIVWRLHPRTAVAGPMAFPIEATKLGFRSSTEYTEARILKPSLRMMP